MPVTKYPEIKALYRYCFKHGIPCNIQPLCDGYKIIFPSGGDFVQHEYSYGSSRGCVEPAIGCRADYTAVTLRNAKEIVRRHKSKLMRRAH